MIYIPEAEDIYFAKTKLYFNEVLSNYANGNYRSAVVMLYSVAICDLLFKLQELADMYNDSIAVGILQEVEKCRNSSDNKSKSRWEKEFVDNIYCKTELLDLESYTNLNHLYDHRNFSAHPALNNRYELISPSKEITIALIKKVLEDILIKPPIFFFFVTDMLVEDLSEKKSIYRDEPEKLHEYLRRKYFDRMSVSMKKSTFRSFWKLCFCLPDDEDCQHNIKINRTAMDFLFSDTEGLLDFMRADPMFAKTSPNAPCVIQLSILLANHPQIYQVLSEDTKLQISSLIAKDYNMRMISWFTSSSKAEHMHKMIKFSNFDTLSEDTIRFITNQYELSGDLTCFIDYCIEYFGCSSSFDGANDRYVYAVRPFLIKMTRDQFIRLITVIDNNKQIYKRNANYATNTEIAKSAYSILGVDFDFSQYKNFTFDKEKALGEEKNDDPDEELPF